MATIRTTLALVLPLAALLALGAADARAQAGRNYYINGISGAPGSACSSAGCHNRNPLVDMDGRVMRGAGSVSTILGSRDAGMQAMLTFYSYAQLQQIADWLLSLTTQGGGGTPAPATTTIREYYHAAFGHYFITANPDEMNALDTGAFPGWTRTGQTFKAYATSGTNLTPVCRFFTHAAQFAPKSSHFYTANPDECQGLIDTNGAVWEYEGQVFYMKPVDPATGRCPSGTQGIFRLYNNGQTGAPNHRYTTDPSIRADMMARGYVPEGAGPENIAFCAPL